MVQILPEVPSFGTSLARGLGAGFSKGMEKTADFSMQLMQEKQKEKRMQDLLKNIQSMQSSNNFLSEGIPKYNQEQLLAMKLSGDKNLSQAADFILKQQESELKQQKTQQELSEKKQSIKNAINSLDEIESLIDSPGIGLLGKFNVGEEARFNRGKFTSLQSAVLPLFKKMFPRGMTQEEFKFIQKHYIPQASDTEQTIRGKIEGLKQLAVEEEIQDFSKKSIKNKVKEKFDISNPSHKARRDQVLTKTKGDRQKAEQILMKEFDL